MLEVKVAMKLNETHAIHSTVQIESKKEDREMLVLMGDRMLLLHPIILYALPLWITSVLLTNGLGKGFFVSGIRFDRRPKL